MQSTHERRDDGVRRVPIDVVVDVCAGTEGGAAFQASAVDVSGRGMQVRSSFVPEKGTPLMLRFRDTNGDVVAEGEVAWSQPSDEGGDFGIRFTALDSQSVHTLKALCRADDPAATTLEQSRPAPSVEVDAREPFEGKEVEPRPVTHAGAADASPDIGADEEAEDTDPAPPVSARLKLHIDGVRAPLEGKLKERDPDHVAIGSSLDFLTVGRSVSIEDPDSEARRDAHIGDVSVQVDPESHVPELVVSVRYSSSLGDGKALAAAVGTGEPDESSEPTFRKPRETVPQRLAARKAAPSVAPSDAITRPVLAAPRDAESPREAGSGADDSLRSSAPPPDPYDDWERDDEEEEQSEAIGSSRERVEELLSGVSVAARGAFVQLVGLGRVAAGGAGRFVRRARGSLAHSGKQRPRRAEPLRRTAAPPRSLTHSAARRPELRSRSGRKR